MAAPKLDSMLLASTDPGRLADWYAAAFAPERDDKNEGYRMMSLGGFYLVFDRRDDVSPANPEPGRMILNFDVDDAKAAVERIEAAGTTWVAPLEDRDGSFFATATDPDGNLVQVIQMSDEHVKAMEEMFSRP